MKIAVLGFAHGHVNSYCVRWRDDPGMDIQVVKGWDHDQTRLTAAAQAYGLTPCADVAGILADQDIKAVVIAAETARHAELAVAAADAGKAIVIQKPMALTMTQADQIVAAVNRNRVPCTVAWQMRVDPQNLYVKDMLAQGRLGQIFQFRRRHGLGVCLNHEFAKSWHVSSSMNRDIWADDAAHPIDLIYWLFGLPESVTAEIESLFDPDMPNDNGIAIFRYPGGPLVEVHCSFVSVGAETTMEIWGDKGFLTQSYGDAVSAAMPRDPQAVGMKYYLRAEKAWTDCGIPSPNAQGVRIAGLAQPLADFLHGRRPPIATAEEGRDVLRMVLATYVSNDQGRRVTLDDPAIQAYPPPN
ncbi:MAG TPA: Gfo/Idh/MocA family oxidoreductase [Lentisphaeria bacterium]|nr:Gfo/Idh/MocA family oxidoreductase [Lentisphaerota bacterium]OQC12646.1 MAG: putative oxidoreductase YdgJ [Lentisphaerae bacterium ADurb.Bin082]HQC52314.1 Gfo/Idh/MocA family oxidoreductase [Lentisphaeria bacterium]HQL86716.1 Gfo/Idh/MocA family oxidoreductase [Lentisphaeria bacterium]